MDKSQHSIRKVDVAVIGAGSAGLPAYRAARKAGRPADPAPMTATSTLLIDCCDLSIFKKTYHIFYIIFKC